MLVNLRDAEPWLVRRARMRVELLFEHAP